MKKIFFITIIVTNLYIKPSQQSDSGPAFLKKIQKNVGQVHKEHEDLSKSPKEKVHKVEPLELSPGGIKHDASIRFENQPALSKPTTTVSHEHKRSWWDNFKGCLCPCCSDDEPSIRRGEKLATKK